MSLVSAGGYPFLPGAGEGGRSAFGDDARTVVVGGGLQGVGTTTLAALVALAAAAAGRRVLLVDTDGEGGALPRWMGVRGAPPAGGETVQLRPGLALARGGRGAGTGPPGSAAGRYDLVVVDAGWRMETLAHAWAAGVERALLVSTSGRASLSATFGLIKALSYRFAGTRFDVVMNQQAGGTARQSLEHLQTASLTFLGRSFAHAWTVPEDACLRAGIRGGMLLEDAVAESEVAEVAATMAMRIVAEIEGKRALLAKPLTLAGEL